MTYQVIPLTLIVLLEMMTWTQNTDVNSLTCKDYIDSHVVIKQDILIEWTVITITGNIISSTCGCEKKSYSRRQICY